MLRLSLSISGGGAIAFPLMDDMLGRSDRCALLAEGHARRTGCGGRDREHRRRLSESRHQRARPPLAPAGCESPAAAVLRPDRSLRVVGAGLHRHPRRDRRDGALYRQRRLRQGESVHPAGRFRDLRGYRHRNGLGGSEPSRRGGHQRVPIPVPGTLPYPLAACWRESATHLTSIFRSEAATMAPRLNVTASSRVRSIL